MICDCLGGCTSVDFEVQLTPLGEAVLKPLFVAPERVPRCSYIANGITYLVCSETIRELSDDERHEFEIRGWVPTGCAIISNPYCAFLLTGVEVQAGDGWQV